MRTGRLVRGSQDHHQDHHLQHPHHYQARSHHQPHVLYLHLHLHLYPHLPHPSPTISPNILPRGSSSHCRAAREAGSSDASSAHPHCKRKRFPLSPVSLSVTWQWCERRWSSVHGPWTRTRAIGQQGGGDPIWKNFRKKVIISSIRERLLLTLQSLNLIAAANLPLLPLTNRQ